MSVKSRLPTPRQTAISPPKPSLLFVFTLFRQSESSKNGEYKRPLASTNYGIVPLLKTANFHGFRVHPVSLGLFSCMFSFRLLFLMKNHSYASMTVNWVNRFSVFYEINFSSIGFMVRNNCILHF